MKRATFAFPSHGALGTLSASIALTSVTIATYSLAWADDLHGGIGVRVLFTIGRPPHR